MNRNSDHWAPNATEAKHICAGIIIQALHDLEHLGTQLLPEYASHRAAESALRLQRRIEHDRRTARAFFLESDTGFDWMAGGLGIDIEAFREEIRRRLA